MLTITVPEEGQSRVVRSVIVGVDVAGTDSEALPLNRSVEKNEGNFEDSIREDSQRSVRERTDSIYSLLRRQRAPISEQRARSPQHRRTSNLEGVDCWITALNG